MMTTTMVMVMMLKNIKLSFQIRSTYTECWQEAISTISMPKALLVTHDT